MMKTKKKRKHSRLTWLLIAIFALTACVSSYMIISTLTNSKREQNTFDELSAAVEQERTQQMIPDGKSPKSEHTTIPAATELPDETDAESVILTEYLAVYEQNDDIFGWLRIDGTPIDYPVMHTPDDPQYYLHRAFDKSSTQSGTPFLDAACYEGCGNYIIYGHHMKNGTMFGSLSKYAEKEYWEEHKTIFFDTLYEHGEFEIIAAFFSKIYVGEEQGFRYYQYIDLTDPSAFEEYTDQINTIALYNTGVTVEYGAELITLSTCSYHTTNGRFVVVAKKK